MFWSFHCLYRLWLSFNQKAYAVDEMIYEFAQAPHTQQDIMILLYFFGLGGNSIANW